MALLQKRFFIHYFCEQLSFKLLFEVASEALKSKNYYLIIHYFEYKFHKTKTKKKKKRKKEKKKQPLNMVQTKSVKARSIKFSFHMF